MYQDHKSSSKYSRLSSHPILYLLQNVGNIEWIILISLKILTILSVSTIGKIENYGRMLLYSCVQANEYYTQKTKSMFYIMNFFKVKLG